MMSKKSLINSKTYLKKVNNWEEIKGELLWINPTHE